MRLFILLLAIILGVVLAKSPLRNDHKSFGLSKADIRKRGPHQYDIPGEVVPPGETPVVADQPGKIFTQ